jgi:hypothetical protein
VPSGQARRSTPAPRLHPESFLGHGWWLTTRFRCPEPGLSC